MRRVRGNAIWTHSNYRSPRNANGIVAAEHHRRSGARRHPGGARYPHRRVENNAGPAHRVSAGARGSGGAYPPRSTPPATWISPSTPATISKTSTGNAWISTAFTMARYAITHASAANRPINIRTRSTASSSITPILDMQPVNIAITGNLIDGAGYGGIFLIGSGNVVSRNRLLRIEPRPLHRRHASGALQLRFRSACVVAQRHLPGGRCGPPGAYRGQPYREQRDFRIRHRAFLRGRRAWCFAGSK